MKRLKEVATKYAGQIATVGVLLLVYGLSTGGGLKKPMKGEVVKANPCNLKESDGKQVSFRMRVVSPAMRINGGTAQTVLSNDYCELTLTNDIISLGASRTNSMVTVRGEVRGDSVDNPVLHGYLPIEDSVKCENTRVVARGIQKDVTVHCGDRWFQMDRGLRAYLTGGTQVLKIKDARVVGVSDE